jgi:hypothetical protein
VLILDFIPSRTQQDLIMRNEVLYGFDIIIIIILIVVVVVMVVVVIVEED